MESACSTDMTESTKEVKGEEHKVRKSDDGYRIDVQDISVSTRWGGGGSGWRREWEEEGVGGGGSGWRTRGSGWRRCTCRWDLKPLQVVVVVSP